MRERSVPVGGHGAPVDPAARPEGRVEPGRSVREPHVGGELGGAPARRREGLLGIRSRSRGRHRGVAAPCDLPVDLEPVGEIRVVADGPAHGQVSRLRRVRALRARGGRRHVDREEEGEEDPRRRARPRRFGCLSHLLLLSRVTGERARAAPLHALGGSLRLRGPLCQAPSVACVLLRVALPRLRERVPYLGGRDRHGLLLPPAVLSEDRPAFGVEHRPAQAHLPVREERHVPPVLPAEPRGVHVERAELVAADVPAVDDGVGGQADDVERPLLVRPPVRVLDALADERLVERDVDVLLLCHFFSFPMLSFAAGAFRRPPSGRAGRGSTPITRPGCRAPMRRSSRARGSGARTSPGTGARRTGRRRWSRPPARRRSRR